MQITMKHRLKLLSKIPGPLCAKPEYNQCQNGGTCQEDDTGNSTTCACPPKFTGTFCETMVDNTFCDNMPCRNGGICNINQHRTSYVCTCPRGKLNFNYWFWSVKMLLNVSNLVKKNYNPNKNQILSTNSHLAQDSAGRPTERNIDIQTDKLLIFLGF